MAGLSGREARGAAAPVPRTLLVFVLSPEVERVEAVLAAARDAGLAARLFCPHYEAEMPEEIAGHRVRFPMSYLDDDDVEQAYEDTWEWVGRFAAVRLDDGDTVEARTSLGGGVPGAWFCAMNLNNHVHPCIRFISAVRGALDAAPPSHYAIVGRHATLDWIDPVLRRTVAARVPGAADVGGSEDPDTSARETPRAPSPEDAERAAKRVAQRRANAKRARRAPLIATPGVTGPVTAPASRPGAPMSPPPASNAFTPAAAPAPPGDQPRDATTSVSRESPATLRLLGGLRQIATGALSALRGPRATFALTGNATAGGTDPSANRDGSSPARSPRPLRERASKRARLPWKVPLALRRLRGQLDPARSQRPRRRIVVLLPTAESVAYSFKHGREVVTDQYLELVPEALLELCMDNDWHLTIIYGHGLPSATPGTGYAASFPDHVTELYLQAIVARTMWELATPYRGAFTDRVMQIVDDPGLRGALEWKGVDISDALLPVLERLVRACPNQMATYRLWRTLLRMLAPDLLVGGRLELRNAICHAAHDEGAEVVSLALGLGQEMLIPWAGRAADGTPRFEYFPDRLLTWGEEQARRMNARMPAEGPWSASCGRPRNDTFVHAHRVNDPGALRERLGYAQTDRIIVFGCNCRTRWGQGRNSRWGTNVMSPGEVYTHLAALRAVVDLDPRLVVVIKPHPADDEVLLQGMIDRLDRSAFRLFPANHGVHNHEILSAAEIFVCNCSSMFAEALICDTVCVNISTEGTRYFFDRYRRDQYERIASTVTDPASFAALMRRLVDDPAYREERLALAQAALGPCFGSADGNNAERVAHWCADLLGPAAAPAAGLASSR